MLDHLYGMLCLAFLIVLLVGFLAGGLNSCALCFLAVCGIALTIGGVVYLIIDLRNSDR